MNKAAFLNIIRQVAPIQDQEVEDLEELVASFPYCQTAHILLAKAAYERGSMLSTQKLRKAAAHASSRQLLKRIIYAAPIVQTTVDQEIPEEETQAVFAPFPENEAKITFPQLAPEEGILQALNNLSEEDLLDAEVDVPNVREQSEEEEVEESSIEEPVTEDQENSEVEEPATDVEDSFDFEEEVLETSVYEDADLYEEEQQEEVQSPDAENEAVFASEYELAEKDSAFIEDLLEVESHIVEESIEQEIITEEEPVEELIHSLVNEEDSINLEGSDWEENIEEKEQIDVVDAFDGIEEPSPEEVIIFHATEDKSILAETKDFLVEEESPSVIPEEEDFQIEAASPAPELPVFYPEVEADFITNAVKKLNSVTTDFAGLDELFATGENEVVTALVSHSEEVISNGNAEEALLLLPEEGLSISISIGSDSQEDITVEEASFIGAQASIEEDELFSLMQIDSLVTLTAPIPSVNLTHAEIISELTSKPEPNELSHHENAIQEEVAETAAQQDGPVLVSPELVGFVAGLQGVQVQEERIQNGEQGSYPMLQMAPAVVGSLEAETEKDPYLSIFYHNSLAYWMDSSRMGETIQLRDELTTSKPYYFQPDLILEHVKGNGALEQVVKPVAKLDVQLSIIDQFLKSNPKLKSMAHSQQKSEPQEDLSAKSSKIKKNLASENLALIFIRQGKYKKALKIYEQLIMKFPEKKSYFAEQIEKLRNEL